MGIHMNKNIVSKQKKKKKGRFCLLTVFLSKTGIMRVTSCFQTNKKNSLDEGVPMFEYMGKLQNPPYCTPTLIAFCLSVVLRPHQTAGIWLHYPEGQRAEGWRPPHQLKAQRLADIKTAVLGHSHPRGALWVLWSGCSPRGWVTSYFTKAAISHRERYVAAGGCSWLGQLHMSQVRILGCII